MVTLYHFSYFVYLVIVAKTIFEVVCGLFRYFVNTFTCHVATLANLIGRRYIMPYFLFSIHVEIKVNGHTNCVRVEDSLKIISEQVFDYL